MSERATILQGDALALLRGLPDDTFHAVITDPPYNSGGASTTAARGASTSTKYVSSDAKTKLTDFAGDSRDQRSFALWCALWLAEALRVTREGSPLCVFCDWRQLAATIDAVQVAGWAYKGCIPWDKLGGRPRRGGFRAQCEFIIWASKGPIRERDVGYLPGIVRVASDRKRLHQVGKPLEAMAAVVEICEPGGLVLDPFAGSATTGVACLRSGRRFLGIELLPHYAEVARKRLEAEAA